MSSSVIDHVVGSIEEREAKRRSKMADLMRLLRDPVLADVVAELFTAGRPPNAGASKAAPRKVDGGLQNGGNLRGAIRALASELPAQFTSRDIFQLLTAKHYKFTKRKPQSSIRDCILAMKKVTNEIRVVKPAEGEAPQVYEFTEKLR